MTDDQITRILPFIQSGMLANIRRIAGPLGSAQKTRAITQQYLRDNDIQRYTRELLKLLDLSKPRYSRACAITLGMTEDDFRRFMEAD